MTLYKNKYRVESTRLPYWDYSSDGWYFITICVKNCAEYFGEVHDYVTELLDIGHIAAKFWNEIPKHFPFVRLDEWTVMPNHLHGIIVIDKYDDNNRNENNHNPVHVETQNFASLRDGYANKFGPQSKNLASIIRGFKIGVKKYATINNIDFAWQPRFYDHIIRNQKSLDEIRQYIYDNPGK